MSEMLLWEKIVLELERVFLLIFGQLRGMPAINLYREAGFTNMAQAQRLCGYGLKHILALFRMK